MTVGSRRNVQATFSGRRSRFAAGGGRRLATGHARPGRSVLDPDATEPDPLVEGEAGGVLRDDARPQGPDAGRFGCRDEDLEQGTTDTSAARVGGDIHAFPGDPAIDVAARVRPERAPAEHRAARPIPRDEPAIGAMCPVERVPTPADRPPGSRPPWRSRRRRSGARQPRQRLGHRIDADARAGRARRQAPLRHDRVAEGAESLDPQDDLVTRLQVAPERRVAHLEEAAGPDGPAADQVAGPQPRVGRRPRQHLRRTRTARRTSGRGWSPCR